MIKVKLQEIINNLDNIKALQEVKMPIKTSYRIKRLVDKLNPIVKSYEENRNELIKEMGEKDEKSDQITVKPENQKEFYIKLQDLLDVEEEIEYTPIKIEELGNVELPAKTLVGFIFVD